LYCSYFGVALALIFQPRFTGFGSWIAISALPAVATVIEGDDEDQRIGGRMSR
jgi:hypothetical protein